MSHKKVIRRGAEPKKPKKVPKTLPWKAVPWRTLSLSISVFAILYGVHLWKEQWKIDDVIIRGELRVFNAKDVAKELLWLKQENFFDVDLDLVKDMVIDMPLIADARIQKVWPASIEIQLLQAKPVAIWNDKKLLGSDGQLSDLPNKELPELSHISGAERYANHAVETYPLIQSELKKHDLSIKSLHVSNLGAFEVYLDEDKRIKFGRKRLVQRLARLDKLLQTLDVKSIQSIDLRYGRGAAVLLKDKEALQENKS